MTGTYDVVIIGAGIHGAGVAQAAAAMGYRVLVLEQNEIASGTSSRSSKLIHGGLRYLETGQFGLVRECLHERDLLLQLAPDLIHLKPFIIPVYRQTSRSPLAIRVGLSLYSLLDGFGSTSGFDVITKKHWPELDGLKCDQLRSVFRYYDAQTDDSALTRAVLHSAQTLGAEVNIHARMASATVIDHGTKGVTVQYQQDGLHKDCHASVLVNAAGPWVNEVLACVTPKPEMLAIDKVQGTHIIVDGEMRQGIYYLESPSDRRAVFVMPWQGRTMVGTTETVYHGDPAKVEPLPAEQQYLLEILQHYFPQYKTVTLEQLTSFAGLRILPASDHHVFRRKRDTHLLVNNERQPVVLSIYGGKLTAYRTTALSVMKRIQASLPTRKTQADTAQLPLLPVD